MADLQGLAAEAVRAPLTMAAGPLRELQTSVGTFCEFLAPLSLVITCFLRFAGIFLLETIGRGDFGKSLDSGFFGGFCFVSEQSSQEDSFF